MLGKYNRTTISRTSGAIIAGATVNFYSQSSGAPVTVYSAVEGGAENSLGSEIQSDNDGKVSVFMNPGIYRVTISDGAGVIDELTHEVVVNPLAASVSGITFQRTNHSVTNLKLFIEKNASGLSFEFYTRNPNDLSLNTDPSSTNPIRIDFQDKGNSITLSIKSPFAAILPDSEDLGLGTDGSIKLFVYAITNPVTIHDPEDDEFWIGLAVDTNFYESEGHTIIDYDGNNFDFDSINSLNGAPGAGALIRLVGQITATRTAGAWVDPADADYSGYTADQTYMSPKAKDLLFEATASGMKDVLDFTTIGKNLSTVADVAGTRFFRANSDGSISMRTAAELRDADLSAAGTGIQNTFSQEQTFQNNVILTGGSHDITIGGDHWSDGPVIAFVSRDFSFFSQYFDRDIVTEVEWRTHASGFTFENAMSLNLVTGLLTAKTVTQSNGDNSTNLASTAYVDNAVASGGSGDVSKDGSSTADNFALWSGTGNLIKAGGKIDIGTALGTSNANVPSQNAVKVYVDDGLALKASYIVAKSDRNSNSTFGLPDNGRNILHSNSTAHSFTIPPNSTTAFPIGATITVSNIGSGTVSIVRGSGVTNYLAGDGTNGTHQLPQWAMATLLKINTDTWITTGVGIS